MNVQRPRPYGEALRLLRERKGLTQRELAIRASVGITTVSDAEQGRTRRLRRSSLERLARALEVPPAELDGRDLPHDQRIHLGVLGPMTATRPDGAPINLGPERRRAVLGLLALSPGAVVQLDFIIDALWPEDPPASAANAVQGFVSRLRRLLTSTGVPNAGDNPLERIHRGYRLNLDEEELDLLAFRGLVTRARHATERGDLADACAFYGNAIARWRDAPLSDVAVLRTHPWVGSLASERMTATIDYADAAARLGRHDEVIPFLRAATQLESLHGAAHARLMISLANSGQRAAALEVFHAVRSRLAEDLGIDPDRELVDAYQYVIHHDDGNGAPDASYTGQAAPGRRGADTRERVIRAVARLIAGAGLEAVSMGDVAAEAGVPVGTVRHYGRGKDELLLLVFRHEVDRARMAAVSPDTPARTGLERALQELLPLDGERADEKRVYVAFAARAAVSSQVSDVQAASLAALRRLCGDFLRAGQRDGTVDPSLDVETEAALLAALTDGLILHSLTDPDGLPPDGARHMLNGHIERLFTTGPRGSSPGRTLPSKT